MMDHEVTKEDVLLGGFILMVFFTLVILIMVCTLSPHCLCYPWCPCGRYEKKKLKSRQPKVSLANITPSFFWTSSAKQVTHEHEKVPTLQDQLDVYSEQDTLNPSLYRAYDSMLRRESASSDEDGRASRANGNVVFTVTCTSDEALKEKVVFLSLKSIKDLPQRLYGGISYIYVKVQLLARNAKKPKLPGEVLDVQQSNVHQRCGETAFEEDFVFHFPAEKSNDIVLKLMSFEFDKYSRHEWKGELQIVLQEYDLAEAATFTEELKPPKQEANGEIMLSMSYLPTSGKVHMGIIKCRDLNLREDPDALLLVKAVMLQGKNTLQKKRTKSKETTRDPSFNETIIFDVPVEFLDKVGFIVSVIHKAAQGQYKDIGEKIVGTCCLGQVAQGTGYNHWMEMLRSPRKAIAQWHELR